MLVKFVQDVVLPANEITKVVVGGANGWDQAVNQAAINLNIPFIAALPFKKFDERWPLLARKRLSDMLAKAEDVVYVCEHPSKFAFQKRNEYMVDNSWLLIALWNGTKGGTDNCLQYANKKKKPVVNVWNQWLEFYASNS